MSGLKLYIIPVKGLHRAAIIWKVKIQLSNHFRKPEEET